MSREHEVMYEIERRRREELERQRAVEYVEKTLVRIRSQVKEMKDKEYDAYIPDEMGQIQQYVNDMESLLSQDVFAARERAGQAERIVHSADYLARCAKEEFQRQEMLRYQQLQRQRDEARSNLLEFYYEQISLIRNPSVINFSVHDLNILKESIEQEAITGKENVLERIGQITRAAEISLQKWKEEKLEREKVVLLRTLIDNALQEVVDEKFESNEKKEQLLAKMKGLKDGLSSSSSEDEVICQLRNIRQSVDSAIIDEKVRRETVRSIIKVLKAQEFSVSKPKIVGEGKDSYVLVRATKPSGKQATCKINLEGSLNYRFDNYEGMTCLKDIEKFSIDLSRIYSVNLSDERIIWENPDRLSRTQSTAGNEDRRNV